jgi:hypothetical protein
VSRGPHDCPIIIIIQFVPFVVVSHAKRRQEVRTPNGSKSWPSPLSGPAKTSPSSL